MIGKQPGPTSCVVLVFQKAPGNYTQGSLEGSPSRQLQYDRLLLSLILFDQHDVGWTVEAFSIHHAN